MAFSFGFFNSKNLDRTYTAENFNEYRRWNECYERLLRFIEQNVRLPLFSKTDKSERLIRTWIKNQQIAYKNGKLSDEQAEKLRNLEIKL